MRVKYQPISIDMLYSAKYGRGRVDTKDRSAEWKKCYFFISNSTHSIRILVAMASIY